jgi:hypothetical protein
MASANNETEATRWFMVVIDYLHLAILFKILRRIATKISRVHYQPIAMLILWAPRKYGV